MRIPSPDEVADIIEAAYSPPEKRELDSPDPMDCVYDEGVRLGALEGRSDFQSNSLGTPDPAMAMQTNREWIACNEPVDVSPSFGIGIPSLSNPVLAALEVALTPSVANAPEIESLHDRQFSQAAPDAFANGYYDGYSKEASSIFDAMLEDRLQVPFYPGEVSASPDAHALDERIPPLSVDVTSSGGWGSGSPNYDSPDVREPVSSGSGSSSD